MYPPHPRPKRGRQRNRSLSQNGGNLSFRRRAEGGVAPPEQVVEIPLGTGVWVGSNRCALSGAHQMARTMTFNWSSTGKPSWRPRRTMTLCRTARCHRSPHRRRVRSDRQLSSDPGAPPADRWVRTAPHLIGCLGPYRRQRSADRCLQGGVIAAQHPRAQV